MSPDQLQELKLNGFLMGLSFLVVIAVNAIMRKRHAPLRSTVFGRIRTGLVYGLIACVVAPSVAVLIFGRLELFQFAYMSSVCVVFGLGAFWVPDGNQISADPKKKVGNLDDWKT